MPIIRMLRLSRASRRIIAFSAFFLISFLFLKVMFTEDEPNEEELLRLLQKKQFLQVKKHIEKLQTHGRMEEVIFKRENNEEGVDTMAVNQKKEEDDTDKNERGHIRQQQLQKLADMGGMVLEKKSEDAFVGVHLPPFVTSRDPNGPGEGGRAVTIDVKSLNDEEKSKYNKGWAANSFNQYASDMMSIYRSLPDGRSDACKEQAKGYSPDLQDVSVIIIFHNEAWTVLLRSVHSILARTPEHLLREIILVDDFSSNDDLKAPLEKYFNSFAKVQIIRSKKRQGLTRARLLGYFLSSAPVVVFLDSHIECFPGWLEPLSSRLRQNAATVVFPSIEVIDDSQMSTQENTDVGQNGMFVWKDLTFNWQNIPESENRRRRNNADPVRFENNSFSSITALL